jgi:3'-phosphoadenosine 5'-phosphosulfate sulfotransferase (PAPS reductase)/FAD synthetase
MNNANIENRVIVAISGGISSAWCADWALRKYGKKNVVLYFNDTKWEHPDLYRFLDDLEILFSHKILYDSDGRSPRELFIDERFLGNNRVPICSRILKAERLKNFYNDGDVIVFGIGCGELNRANRIVRSFQLFSAKSNKFPKIEFPLISGKVSNEAIHEFIQNNKLRLPELYRNGFAHNNCYGGCVRAGKSQWKKLLQVYPEIYRARESLEIEMSGIVRKKVTYLKDLSLSELRIDREQNRDIFETPIECFGICDSHN